MSSWPYPYMGNYDGWKLSSPPESPCDTCPEAGKCKRAPTACWEEAKNRIEWENADHE